MRTIKFKYTLVLVALTGLLLGSCDDGYDYYDGIYITGTTGYGPLYNFTIDDVFPKVLDINVASSHKVDQDVHVLLSTDASLVEEYNKKFNAKYLPMPEGTYVLSHSSVVIKAGNYSTTDPVQFKVLSKDGFINGENYMMAVTIDRIGGGQEVIEASRTIFVALNEVIVRSALNMGSSGFLGTTFASQPEDAKKHDYDVTRLYDLTLELRVNMADTSTNWFNALMGLEENFAVRVSTYDKKKGKLEVAGGGIENGKDETFPLRTWTHVATVYSGDAAGNGNLWIYVNGEEQLSVPVTRSAGKEFVDLTYRYGSSWSGYDYLIGNHTGNRYLNGMVSEGRVWARALTASEIRGNMCAVNAASEGLLAYWYFDEEGTVFKDATGHGYDMHRLSGSFSYVEVRCPEN